MDLGITVEERRWRTLIPNGIAAGLCAGVALGLAQVLISVAQKVDVLTSLRLVAFLVLGSGALLGTAPTALVMTVGLLLHFFLAALFGVLFIALLSLSFQLSARVWILVVGGFIFGFLLWEVNFLAILPGLYPSLAAEVGLSSELWRGLFAYAVVYGPVLGLYVAATRPGVVSDWRW